MMQLERPYYSECRTKQRGPSRKSKAAEFAGILIIFTVILLSSSLAQNQSSEKPNVIFILADDLGYGDLQCYGNPFLETPEINKLAHAGVLLTHYYSPSPLCAPARAAILTGMYNHRTGAIDVSSNRGIDRIALSYKTIGNYFKERGYATGLIGKWHNGLYDLQYHPNRRGFDYFFGFLNGIQDYWKWNLDLNGKNIPSDGRYLTDVITKDALDFIEKNRSKPFFLLIAHHAPHVPLEAPDSLVQKYLKLGKGSLNLHVATLYAMIEEMDRGVGEVVDKVSELGLTRKTIIVFTSDNGGMLNAEDNRYEHGLSGNKGNVLEEGIRVPAIVSWPGIIPPNRVINEFVFGCDWIPTLFDLTGNPLKPEKKLDGKDIAGFLKGNKIRKPESRELFFQKNRYYPVAHSDAGVIMGAWKLYWPGIPETMKKEKKDNESVWYGTTHPHWEMPVDTIIPMWHDAVAVKNPMLFNLFQDPAERKDVAAQHPELVKKMAANWDSWFNEVMADYKVSWEEIKKTERERWSKSDK